MKTSNREHQWEARRAIDTEFKACKRCGLIQTSFTSNKPCKGGLPVVTTRGSKL